MSDDKVVSLSGAPIRTHREPEPGPHPPKGDSRLQAEIERHVEAYIGPIASALDDPVSEYVRINLHWIPPNSKRNCHTLVTSGMSDVEMNAPGEAADCRLAELMISLPPTWPFGPDAFQDEAHFWPIRLLCDLARFPHVHNTWIWYGHTFPNGHPPEPYHPSTEFCCALLVTPPFFPHDFHHLKTSEGEELILLSVIPLYADEVELKLRLGVDSLLDHFAERGVSDIVDVGRPSALIE